jgi:hypothetical protein
MSLNAVNMNLSSSTSSARWARPDWRAFATALRSEPPAT